MVQVRAEAASRRTPVVIQVWWGDILIHAGPVMPRETFSLGERACDIAVSSAGLGSPHETIVFHRRDVPHAQVPPHAHGSVRLGEGRVLSLTRLRREAAFRAGVSGRTEIPVAVGAEVQLELGALAVRIFRPAPTVAPVARRWVDRRLTASLVAGAAAASAVLGLARHAMPPLGDTVDDDEMLEMRHSDRYVLTVEVAAEEEVVPAWGPTPDTEPAGVSSDHTCGEHGVLGATTAQPGDDRYGVTGPMDNPDPHIARLHGNDLGFPLLGFDPTVWGPGRTPITPWGRDDALGTDPISAQGHMWGEEIADAKGTGGMGGTRVSGRPGKVMVSEAAEMETGGAPPRVFHSGLSVEGALRASAILPVVGSRFARFQSCYAAALEREPSLGGRVDVALTIEPVGTLGEVAVAQASLSTADAGLTACVVGAFVGLSFPRHEGGATRAIYPLSFEPGSETVAAARPARYQAPWHPRPATAG